MFQKSESHHLDDAPPTWPPRADARYDPVVFDTERRVTLSLDDAAAALNGHAAATPPDDLGSLASFQPEHHTPRTTNTNPPERASVPLRRPVTAQRVSWPRLIAAGLALLVVGQAALIGVLLLRRGASSADAPAPVSNAVTPAAGAATATAGSAAAPANASASGTATPPHDMVLEPDQASAGRLQVISSPPGATVVIDGKRRGAAPLTINSLAPGTHRVQVVDGASSTEQTVTVASGSLTSLLIPLLPSEAWVNVSAAVTLQVFEQGHLLGTSGDPIQLKPGTHSLEFRNDTLGYVSQSNVSVRSGQLLALKPVLPDGVLQVNAVPWAHVLLDGEPVGDTPLGTLKASLGPHEVRFVHPDRGEQVRQVVISATGPTRVSVDFR